ncbi:hypothetical protein KY495_15085 [Massilia sp. PAMC28688]|nr:maltose acetyltransferase domain-containing protein [Massilia sp. PAMC28688]QYF92091.1 hypothetical protein KY495_15085 [Massilia sp. PAMC28688]
MTSTEKQKMLRGEFYSATDPELRADQAAAAGWMDAYNLRAGLTRDQAYALLTERFARVGDDVIIKAPFHCDYGYNISVGNGVFINFNCVILDVVAVTIGDMTLIGPGCRS